jgi:hypothetical protein
MDGEIMEGSTRIGKVAVPGGYPGHIYLQKFRCGYGNQRYDERLDILHNWYSDLRAYIPLLYHTDDTTKSYATKKEEYTTKIKPMIEEVSKEIEQARKRYKSTFENPAKYDPEEAEYLLLLHGIKERLDVITAITHVIDKAQMDEDEERRTMG